MTDEEREEEEFLKAFQRAVRERLSETVPLGFKGFETLRHLPGRHNFYFDIILPSGNKITIPIANHCAIDNLDELTTIAQSAEFAAHVRKKFGCYPQEVEVNVVQIEFTKQERKDLSALARELSDDPDFLADARENGVLPELLKRYKRKKLMEQASRDASLSLPHSTWNHLLRFFGQLGRRLRRENTQGDSSHRR